MRSFCGLILFLLIPLLVAGCLKKPGDTPAPEFAPETEFGNFTEQPTGSSWLNPQQQQAVRHGNYTGAIVWVADACPPCKQLVVDINWLISNKCWRIDDWEFRTAPANTQVPRVDFVVHGQVMDSVTGYTTAANWDNRKPLLRDIIKRHPAITGAGR